MGYTALLFCPDEKTARTETQVLSELEFTVEACIEPFAAVKKLMSQHFDAVVVDCDNEQNATLLFKSARNSSSNQTSLAVAAVEGQPGVAKAFRIGANLVLTKPINIEQAKGTLRVARGLLRKSEPGKSAAAAPPKPIATKPVPDAKPAAPAATLTAASNAADLSRAREAANASVPKVTPAPAWPLAAAPSPAASAQDDDLLDIDVAPAVKGHDGPDTSEVLLKDMAPKIAADNPRFAGSAHSTTGGGAASAPAPALERAESITTEKPAEPEPSEPQAIVGAAPSFTFGGADSEAASSGGGKKISLGIAAAIIVAVGAYAAWNHFHGAAEQPANDPAPVISSPAPKATKPSSPAVKPSASPTPNQPTSSAGSNHLQQEFDAAAQGEDTDSASSKNSEDSDKAKAAPIMVKGGKVPGAKNKAAADAPAPTLSGLGVAGAAPPPTFATSDAAALKPSLQTLHVSQGVSQGLLVKKVAPAYPASALRVRLEGTVELLATISAEGKISQVKVQSGDSQLSKAAVDAVKQWKYKPYLLNGEPVEIQTQITIKFKLPK